MKPKLRRLKVVNNCRFQVHSSDAHVTSYDTVICHNRTTIFSLNLSEMFLPVLFHGCQLLLLKPALCSLFFCFRIVDEANNLDTKLTQFLQDQSQYDTLKNVS